MLEGLERVDWPRLRHAYGPATDVPGLLRALTAVDRDTREQTVFDLFSNIYHQGTVYEATAPAVHFLIELLGEPAVPAKADVLQLLSKMALGIVPAYPDKEEWRRIVKLTEAQFEDHIAGERASVRRAHDAVATGRDAYAALLRHPGEPERMWAAYTLATLREHAEASSVDLRAALEGERYDGPLCCMALSLGALTDGAPDDVEALRKLLAAPHELKRVAGAIALVGLAYRQARPPALSWLVAVAQASPSLVDAFGLSSQMLAQNEVADGALPADAIRVLAEACVHAESVGSRFMSFPWFGACEEPEVALDEYVPYPSERFSLWAKEWFEYVHAYFLGTFDVFTWRPPD
jgi:hypothetical protein